MIGIIGLVVAPLIPEDILSQSSCGMDAPSTIYDGLKSTKQQRFTEYHSNMASNLKTSTGSYAYHFL